MTFAWVEPQLYIEFSLLCRKKETTTQGQQALAKGRACLHACRSARIPRRLRLFPLPPSHVLFVVPVPDADPRKRHHVWSSPGSDESRC